MVSKGSLVSKFFMVKMIAGNPTERKTYMWTEKKMTAYIKMFIYLKMVLAEIANLRPTQNDLKRLCERKKGGK